MGYLLKEGLKTLCGVNQWSYAVFWKIGCQNPKLLIWEECYYEPASRADNFNGSWIPAEASKVHLLVNKMMMDSHVNIVGEGLVGRVAFTGNHQWILSETYCGDSHPPEVIKEVCQQFSAGMQTVAVIPVLPHGVVQFGSCMTVMENLGFINDVTSLILQLGYVSGAMLTPNYEAKDYAPSSFDSFNYVQSTSQYGLQSNGAAFQASNSSPRISLPVMNGVAKAEVISSSSELWRSQNPDSVYCSNNDSFAQPTTVEANGLCNGGKDELRDCKKEMGQTTFQENNIPRAQFNEHLNMAELIPSFVQDDACVQPELGDDLFDILGADFKNKFLSSCWNSCLSNESASNIQSWDSKKRSLASSESEIFSSAGSDHLLEAVVSKIQPCSKQSMDDNVSCRTTLTTNTSSSSAHNVSLPYGWFGVSDHLTKAGAMSSCFKEESRSYSQGSSIFGSQITSFMEKDHHKAKPCNSVSASRTPDETGKPNRKRLKPGENPRPRPKDRQMFQDRVKELRELVPNGAKCSLDALLERTIKHMVFLQSVTKHADKLKQTNESKIISKDGGLLMKDNYEGGATWAYEVGSQSMVCPIIVEDLNQPRQMLVQMLCDERGLFLEIADIIRGLGLTILKGVLETRNDKIWARFAVEANRDVTRMEIFMSLVRLLEQSSNENAQFQQVPMHSLQ